MIQKEPGLNPSREKFGIFYEIGVVLLPVIHVIHSQKFRSNTTGIKGRGGGIEGEKE